MSTASLDDHGDWTFGRGKNGYLTGADEVEQNVVTRLQEFVDDWFLDVTKGINWIAYLGSRGTRESLIADIKRVVLETEGVAAITSFDFIERPETRRVKLHFSITTIYNIDLSAKTEIQL